MADSTSVGVLTNIFTAPSLAFAAIKERPNPWLPLLVLIVGTFAVQFTYFQVVDLPWMLDQQLQQAGTLTEEQRNQAIDGATRVPASVLGAIQGAFGGIAILIIYALIALYYTGVSFALNDGVKYQQWLALIAWCSLPAVFGLIASFVNLQVTDARFLPGTAEPAVVREPPRPRAARRDDRREHPDAARRHGVVVHSAPDPRLSSFHAALDRDVHRRRARAPGRHRAHRLPPRCLRST